MDLNVVDNFLPVDEFKFLQEQILSNNFPVYHQDYITEQFEITSIKNVCFAHIIYRDNLSVSTYFDLLNQILFSKLEMRSLIRSKVNCYPRTDEIIEHDWHTDLPYEHKGIMFYLNTCDGETRFDGDAVQNKENRIVFFDPSKSHASTSCTDQKCRWNIIANYF